MCSRVTCPTCDRPTYAGCGAHVEQVLGDVPAAQRCQCGAGDQPRKSSFLKSLRAARSNR